jgi:hypothetical protein
MMLRKICVKVNGVTLCICYDPDHELLLRQYLEEVSTASSAAFHHIVPFISVISPEKPFGLLPGRNFLNFTPIRRGAFIFAIDEAKKKRPPSPPKFRAKITLDREAAM